jgi:flagellar biosynthesis protein FlhG
MNATSVLLEPRSAAKPRVRAPIVLVAGGKGGVGKTTLAVNVALALARRKKRTLLVDLDLGLADTLVMLKVSARRTIEDALAGRCRFEDCILRTEHGLDVLPASSGTPEMGNLSDALRTRLVDALRELAHDYDVVIADASSGIGPDVLAFCGLADHVLVVTTPEPASVTDAYGLIKALHAFAAAHDRDVATPELVVNRAGGLEEAESVAAKLRLVCERFLSRSPRNAGWMPGSGAVEIAARFQRPFVLDPRPSLATTCLEALAARIARIGDQWKTLPGAQAIGPGAR